MPKVAADISNELARQIDRMIRDGWFPDHETVLREALSQFVDAKVVLFAKYGSSQWMRIGEYPIARQLIGK